MHCSDASTHSLHKAIIVPLLFKPAIRRSWPLYQEAAIMSVSAAAQAEPAPKRAHEPPRPTALEEVLLTALRDSRRNLIMLEEGKKELEAAVGREQMQFERLQFAYKKATRDAAYARTMEMLLERERAKHAVPN
ncbi:hypothetical protein WJX75_009595 [Coccomyxa subellipsoidea]|uniref:Uncharacterized protein n=1 Tax=Coccomyxa subellipsoidea TaxID=248742 RepID=A0ABR2YB78_9CHLO